MEKEYSFQQPVLGQLDIHMQRMNLDPYSHNIQKLTQSESDLNVRIEPIKISEEK